MPAPHGHLPWKHPEPEDLSSSSSFIFEGEPENWWEMPQCHFRLWPASLFPASQCPAGSQDELQGSSVAPGGGEAVARGRADPSGTSSVDLGRVHTSGLSGYDPPCKR